MTTLIAPAGVKSCFVDGTTYIVDAKGRVSVPATAVPGLIGGGFIYDPTTANLRAKIAAGATASSDIAVSGIKTTDEIIGCVNITDGTNVVVPAVKAELDGGEIGDGNFDTVVQATDAGAAGNALKIALVHDGAALKAGSAAVADGVLTLTFKGGTSTVADMETLITALGGADDIIGIKTGGTGATVLAAGDAFEATDLAGGADAYDELPTITSDGNVQHSVSTANKKLLVLFSTH